MAEATEQQIRAEKLFNKLWNDGAIGAAIQARAKAEFPDIHTIDEALQPALAPVMKRNEELAEELKALREERAADKQAAKDREAEEQKKIFQTQIDEARRNYSLTEEGFDKMIERMKSTGNFQDPEAAAAWVAQKNPPAAVSGPTFGPQSLNLFGTQKADKAMEFLHRDPQGYMDAELSEFVRNPDKYVQDTFGGT